jgi:hypothetical protein
MKKTIPQRARQVHVQNVRAVDGSIKCVALYEWEASKGYHTDFFPVPHYGAVLIGDTQKVLAITVSKKKKDDWLKHWETLKA